MFYNTVIILFLLYPLKNFAYERAPIVKTDKGPVEGEILHTVWNQMPYFSYKGIPYAKPPLNDLRFKPPVEIGNWTNTLTTVKEGHVCPQVNFIDNNIIGDEDCLYLNVFTPQSGKSGISSTLKPVMVFIYGSFFGNGYSNSSFYGPDFLLEENVVVVTFNYRTGAFGFLTLNHKDALGNVGLKDQRMVLQWVQKNIAKFGGDPKEVTLFGQSTGAVAVDLHMLSPNSQGLFQRSIGMSGSVFCPWGFDLPTKAYQNALKLGKRLGINSTDEDVVLAKLKKVSAYDIAKSTDDMTKVDSPFKPTIENPYLAKKGDAVLTDCPGALYSNNKFQMQPHMMGFMQNETMDFVQPITVLLEWMISTFSLLNEAQNFFLGRTSSLSKTLKVFEEDADGIIEFILKELLQITSEAFFLAEIDIKQKTLARGNKFPVYYYETSYNSVYSLHRTLSRNYLNGAAHGDDIGYIFYNSDVTGPNDPSDTFNLFRKKMVRLWTNFAKYGNPTPNGTKDSLLKVNWPDSRYGDQQLIIDKDLKVDQAQINLETSLMELIAVYFRYYSCNVSKYF